MAGVFLDIDGKIKAINLQPQNYILLLKLAIFSKTQYFDKLLKNFTKTRIFFSKSGQVVQNTLKPFKHGIFSKENLHISG